jgi:septum formation protein maf
VLHPADVDEDAIIATLTTAGADPEDVVLALARAKATTVATEYPHDVVIGADSMLFLDGELQGKPHTETEAISRWHKQRGKTAQLITGHHIIAPSADYYAAATTTVRFAADITDTDIAAYAATGEPLPCAGAFTLEALGGWFIDRIEGDPSNVIGLSLPVVRRALYHFGYDVHDFWNRRKAE